MNKEYFTKFVEKTLNELLLFAELYAEQKFSGIRYFKFGRNDAQVIHGYQNIVNEIVSKVYLSENEIYPCVDLVVTKVMNDNSLFIYGIIAGYPPKPFQNNYTKRPGPFIYGVDSGIISPNIDVKDKMFVQKLIDNGLLNSKPLD
jgi:hypothetical protein